MTSYLGVDYSISVKPYLDTGKYTCQFSLAHDKGDEVVCYPLTYLIHGRTNEIAFFGSELEATKVAERIVKIRIQEIINL
jgi:hypothetical protein